MAVTTLHNVVVKYLNAF